MPSVLEPVEWAISETLIDYDTAVRLMEERAEGIAAGSSAELIWLLEHPPLYTAGTSAKPEHLLMTARLPVHQTGRGGQLTYHGPGQRVVYVMLDIRKRAGDVRSFVQSLEAWVIDALATFNVRGETRSGRIGVWVPRQHQSGPFEDKIAAIGIRLKKWISFHGFSLNVNPDLENYSGIVPCGITDSGVTSLADLGLAIAMEDVDNALKSAFERRFGLTTCVPDPARTTCT